MNGFEFIDGVCQPRKETLYNCKECDSQGYGKQCWYCGNLLVKPMLQQDFHNLFVRHFYDGVPSDILWPAGEEP